MADYDRPFFEYLARNSSVAPNVYNYLAIAIYMNKGEQVVN